MLVIQMHYFTVQECRLVLKIAKEYVNSKRINLAFP